MQYNTKIHAPIFKYTDLSFTLQVGNFWNRPLAPLGRKLLSKRTGLASRMALVRGIGHHSGGRIGNDFTR